MSSRQLFACSTKIHFPFFLQMLITLDHAYMSNEIHSFIESEIVSSSCNLQPNFCSRSSFLFASFNLGSWIIKVPSYTLNMYLAIR